MTLTQTRPSIDFTAARRAMINSQLRVTGVNSPAILARFDAVAREDFVPESARASAYMDRAIDLGGGKYLAAPLSHGLMLEEAQPQLGDKVLIVDSGNNYLAELIGPLVGSVEVITPKQASTKSRKKGDFTLVLIDGAVEEVPASLTQRMADGGRILTGHISGSVTRLAMGRKAAGSGGAVALIPIAEVGFPRLAELSKPAAWSF